MESVVLLGSVLVTENVVVSWGGFGYGKCCSA